MSFVHPCGSGWIVLSAPFPPPTFSWLSIYLFIYIYISIYVDGGEIPSCTKSCSNRVILLFAIPPTTFLWFNFVHGHQSFAHQRLDKKPTVQFKSTTMDLAMTTYWLTWTSICKWGEHKALKHQMNWYDGNCMHSKLLDHNMPNALKITLYRPFSLNRYEIDLMYFIGLGFKLEYSQNVEHFDQYL